MLIRSVSKIYFSAFLSVAATVGGWAITSAFEGDGAALSFLIFSVPVVLGALVFQVVLFLKSKERLRLLIIFNLSAAFGVFWMMSCLMLPVFWIESVSTVTKVTICLFSLAVFYSNVLRGLAKFHERWTQIGERVLPRHYKREQGVIDWEKIMESLKLSVEIYIPCIPEKINPVLSVVLVASMLAGYALRKVFPMFSIFAWSIPSLVVIALLWQLVGIAIGQLSVLQALEKRDKQILRLSYN